MLATHLQLAPTTVRGDALLFPFGVDRGNFLISLFHRAFQFTMCNGSTNALVCNKTLIQMSHIKTLKITPTCFDHQLIIIRELFDPS
jgi:hypothetical protein